VWQYFEKVPTNEPDKYSVTCKVCRDVKNMKKPKNYKWQKNDGTGTMSRHLRSEHGLGPEGEEGSSGGGQAQFYGYASDIPGADTPTRWNSTYKLLHDAIAYRDVLTDMYNESRATDGQFITNDHWSLAKIVHDMLKKMKKPKNYKWQKNDGTSNMSRHLRSEHGFGPEGEEVSSGGGQAQLHEYAFDMPDAEYGLRKKVITLDTPTRWNSTYKLLHDAIAYREF
ncbi:Zinc finger BED domain-containing protein 3, partial [Bienertia sinuspersici]